MREKLNSNPMAQLAVIGVLMLAAGLMIMKTMGGGSSEAPTSESSAAGAAAAPAAAPSAAVATTTSTGVAAAPTAVPVVPDPPPLPDSVVAAHESGQAVVVLLVHPTSPEDRLLEREVRGLGVPNTAVFVVPASDIAHYASITQGVNVDRTPALIVIKPKSASAEQPQAIVRYGFRNPESVVQAVVDALYVGASKTYSPE
ncbi:MAG TPA: hypothetical protein VKA89_03215 [Solirubrobacterales bacterium]|nr:hypothetical protein [Solirubrobacterales bacterium]